MKKTIEVTDPRTLRALAHPTRLALVGLLRRHGSLTATQAGRLLGLNSGACSFHLRQLAKYGLVEEVEAPGRQKPWRVTAQTTSWPTVTSGPEIAAAVQLLSGVVAEHYANLMFRWLEHRTDESPEWQEAAWFGDLLLHMTPEELTALREQLEALVAPYQQRVFEPDQRPAGSRLVTVLQVAIPREDLLQPEPEEPDDQTNRTDLG
jgi:predicted ArsR family transcriptional regulator